MVALLAHPPAPALLKPPVSHRPPCVPPCPLRAQACRAGAAGVKLLDGGGNPVAAAALVGRSVPVAGPRITVARGASRSGSGPLRRHSLGRRGWPSAARSKTVVSLVPSPNHPSPHRCRPPRHKHFRCCYSCSAQLVLHSQYILYYIVLYYVIL